MIKMCVNNFYARNTECLEAAWRLVLIYTHNCSIWGKISDSCDCIIKYCFNNLFFGHELDSMKIFNTFSFYTYLKSFFDNDKTRKQRMQNVMQIQD